MADYAAYDGAKPYFGMVRGALGDRVDGVHFFDTISDDVVYEVLYEIAGWPRVIGGRSALMAQFAGYVANVRLHATDKLVVHCADNGQAVILEYEVRGEILATGVAYTNRFASILTLRERKIAHWRDYMDSLAAWNALTARKN